MCVEVARIHGSQGGRPKVNLAFYDDDGNFDIQRPDRKPIADLLKDDGA